MQIPATGEGESRNRETGAAQPWHKRHQHVLLKMNSLQVVGRDVPDGLSSDATGKFTQAFQRGVIAGRTSEELVFMKNYLRELAYFEKIGKKLSES